MKKPSRILRLVALANSAGWGMKAIAIIILLGGVVSGLVYRNIKKNDALAYYNLGSNYYHGHGVTKDYEEAVKWYRKAAEQNNADAQLNLGACYHFGQGVAKDEMEAVKWFRKAAEQNEATAQYFLGECYGSGRGIAKDKVEAVKWWRKAAEQNFAWAQFNLGAYYQEGQGVAKDEMEAVKWFRKAANQNDAGAQNQLGDCYRFGQGVAKDYAEALKWYRKAAELDNAGAQFSLGYCYHFGQGVAMDEVEGYKWYLLAAGQGDEAAKKNMAVAQSQLSREQIAEGQRRASSFMAHKGASAGEDTSSTSVTRSVASSSRAGEIPPHNLEELKPQGGNIKSVRVLRVEPDGLLVEFTPQAGGICIAKIKFEELSADLQQRYGYDAQKVAAYQPPQATRQPQPAVAMWSQQAQNEKEWAAVRAREEDNFRGRQEIDRLENERRKAETERVRAEAERVRNANDWAQSQAERVATQSRANQMNQEIVEQGYQIRAIWGRER